MTTDIDEKLTTLEQLLQLLDAGHVLTARKVGGLYRLASGLAKTDDDKTNASPTDIMLEGLPFAEDWKIEAATGRCLSDVVHGVMNLHDLQF